jgi:hypothetical protein
MCDPMKMHGVHSIKFINAKQAKEIHKYKNLKVKLHKANAAFTIWVPDDGPKIENRKRLD